MPLVITRRINEGILIGTDTVIILRKVHGDKRAVLDIIAPQSVQVDRLEKLPADHPAILALRKDGHGTI